MSESFCHTVVIESVAKHPNADKLDICGVLGGYPCIAQRGTWKEGDIATYVSVDMLVPVAHPSFAWLEAEAKGRTHYRVRAKRLRGTFSMGLLVPAVEGTAVGENVAELLGVEKYVPPSEAALERRVAHNVTRASRKSETRRFDRTTWICAALCSGMAVGWFWWYGIALTVVFAFLAEFTIRRHRASLKRPNVPVYDIEGLRRFNNILHEGEPVVITEKIHGMNAKYIYTNRLHSGSRTQFREGDDVWNRMAVRYNLAEKLKNHKNIVLFGEIYGKGVQDLEYGKDDQDFVAFDAMNLLTRQYMNYADFEEFCKSLDIPMAPVLYRGAWDERLRSLAEGPSTMPRANHMREGFVVQPEMERTEHGLGRCILKFVGEGYLTRKEKA